MRGGLFLHRSAPVPTWNQVTQHDAQSISQLSRRAVRTGSYALLDVADSLSIHARDLHEFGLAEAFPLIGAMGFSLGVAALDVC
jgi:hypothetical protein